MAFTPSGGGISAASDVAFNSPSNNQVIRYNQSVDKWQNATISTGGSTDEWVYNVKDYGATGNGTTDDSVAIKACIAAAIATRGSGTAAVRAEVIFPPGNYYVTQNDTLMTPSDGNNAGVQGLKIRGFGKETTRISFNPTTTSTTNPFVGNLASFNKRVRHMHLTDMTIALTGSKPAANCFYFYHDGEGSNQNQGCTFERLHFSGNWNRVFGFDGGETANLNSEMTFRNISAAGASYGDAFFRVGGISGTFNQQNQFLDYWFYDSFFNLAGGTLFRFDRGGSAHFINGSWSASSGTAPEMTFISIPGTYYNNTSAGNFSFTGIRFEPKAANHTVVDCSMGMGSIQFNSCIDLSSLQSDSSFTHPLHRYVGGSPWGYGVMPTVRYTNCHLAGRHVFEGAAVSRGRVIYDGCYFFRGTGGQMANATTDQSATNPVLTWTTGKPRYTFRDCWNVTDVAN